MCSNKNEKIIKWWVRKTQKEMDNFIVAMKYAGFLADSTEVENIKTFKEIVKPVGLTVFQELEQKSKKHVSCGYTLKSKINENKDQEYDNNKDKLEKDQEKEKNNEEAEHTHEHALHAPNFLGGGLENKVKKIPTDTLESKIISKLVPGTTGRKLIYNFHNNSNETLEYYIVQRVSGKAIKR